MMAGDPPQPRLCHIRKVDNFDGYGFNLHAEKNKPGQFVGKIDEGSPAEKAGLTEGDREDHYHHLEKVFNESYQIVCSGLLSL